MSELSSSTCQFSSLLISDLIRLSSFILSRPLYFSYFLFFSPYLLKLISFLSPLFITTSLLVLAFLAGSSQTRFASVLKRLQFKKDCPNEELHLSDDLGMYETVFGSAPMAAVTENDPSEFSDSVVKSEEGFGETKVCANPGNTCFVMEEKRLENFLKILDEFERLASDVEEKKKLGPPSRVAITKSNQVVEIQKSLLMLNGSEIASDDNKKNHTKAANDAAAKLNVAEECSSPMAKSQSQRIMSRISDHDGHDHSPDSADGKLKVRGESCRALEGGSLWRYGSMGREREWERTLAGKLFEERQNVGGGEGMDSLWEAYEMEEFGKVGRRKKERVKRERIVDEEDEEIGGQVCCMQALKLSAGKVILGVGKPNLVKISKAIRGIGWLHKTSKKVHNHTY